MCNRIEKLGWRWVIAIMVGLLASLVCAEEKSASDSNVQPSFVHIFNGKDLSGWDGDPRLWSVQDGVIRGQTTQEKQAQKNTFCIWRGGKLKNFVLKIKFRIQNGNSGIQYRSKDMGNWRVGGYQAEVCNQQGKVGFLYDERGRGWMARVGQFMVVDNDGKKHVVSKVADSNALIKARYYKEKDWNEYTIISRGNHLVHILNGFQTIEMIDSDPKGRAMEGILALQIHTGPPMTVEFKDIRIRHLADHFGEAQLLFNCKDLNGWTFSSDELKDTWSVRDGVMANTGKPAGYIRTTDDYTNYVLRLQFRHVTKGNSGVLLRAVGEDKVWPRSIEAQGQYGHVGDIWNIGNFPARTDAERTKGRRTAKMHESNEKPLGQWNQYEIGLNGPDLEIKVNDLVQNTASECWETPGKICIQSEASEMEYRNIVLLPVIRDKK
ncbi:MAG: 3-keto-disaccharide hydrolase [Planctomycetota bacterium]